MTRSILLSLVLGLALISHSAGNALAGDTATTKVENAAGDATTDMKKSGRAAKRQVRKATGNDNIAKDAKDKVKDVGDDVSNDASKANRKAQ